MAQLLSNLPVGAKVKFGKYSVNGEMAQPITWLVVAKNHGGTLPYPANSVTLLTEKIIDLRCVDAKEPNNTDGNRKMWGNGRYSFSNIDQWLNKDSAAGAWYVAAHSLDQAPDSTNISDPYKTAYVNRPAFLNAFSDEEKNVILNTTLRVTKHTYDGGGTEDITRKVFLPSVAEVSSGHASSGDSLLWEYFSTSPDLKCTLTEQVIANSLDTVKPSTTSGGR